MALNQFGRGDSAIRSYWHFSDVSCLIVSILLQDWTLVRLPLS